MQEGLAKEGSLGQEEGKHASLMPLIQSVFKPLIGLYYLTQEGEGDQAIPTSYLSVQTKYLYSYLPTLNIIGP